MRSVSTSALLKCMTRLGSCASAPHLEGKTAGSCRASRTAGTPNASLRKPHRPRNQMRYEAPRNTGTRRICVARHSLCDCRRADYGRRPWENGRSHNRRQGRPVRAVLAALRLRADGGACALGICSFAAWCAFQAINDPDGYGRTLKGIIIRIGVLLTGSCISGSPGMR